MFADITSLYATQLNILVYTKAIKKDMKTAVRVGLYCESALVGVFTSTSVNVYQRGEHVGGNFRFQGYCELIIVV